MVIFFSINKTAMVDKRKSEIEYFKTNLPNMEWTSTIGLKQVDEGSEHLVMDSRHSSADEISINAVDDLEVVVQEEGKDELLRMPEDQDNSELRIAPTTYHSLRTHSPGHTAECEDHDTDNHDTEELAQVDAVIHNIALTEQDGANSPNGQAQKEDQTGKSMWNGESQSLPQWLLSELYSAC
jgi:hypothetical protein